MISSTVDSQGLPAKVTFVLPSQALPYCIITSSDCIRAARADYCLSGMAFSDERPVLRVFVCLHAISVNLCAVTMPCALISRVVVSLARMPAARACQSFLHSIQIMHRDLKTTNILVSVLPSKSTAGVFKISDFGMSCFLEANKVPMTMCGTEGLTCMCHGFCYRVCMLHCRKSFALGDF